MTLWASIVLQAPQDVIEQQDQSMCASRKTLHAMMQVVDNVTSTILDLLRSKNMYSNSVRPPPSSSSLPSSSSSSPALKLAPGR